MIEIDGPKTAWYEDDDGTKHVYITYGLGTKGHNTGELVTFLRKWYRKRQERGDTIVWRRRPEIVSETWHSSLITPETESTVADEFWKLTMRCVLIDKEGKEFVDEEFFPIKPEGAPVARQ